MPAAAAMSPPSIASRPAASASREHEVRRIPASDSLETINSSERAGRPGSQFHEWLSEGDKIGRADEASGQRPRLALLSAGGAGACQMTW